MILNSFLLRSCVQPRTRLLPITPSVIFARCYAAAPTKQAAKSQVPKIAEKILVTSTPDAKKDRLYKGTLKQLQDNISSEPEVVKKRALKTATKTTRTLLWQKLQQPKEEEPSSTHIPPPPIKPKPAPVTQLQQSLPTLARPAVGRWLLLSSVLVLAVIVVGGVTRLTESGLSITEWQPVTGILPPLSLDEWNVEFDKYKTTPEFKLINHSITLDEFKSIFYMEWGHRVLGRLIGLVFVGPLVYFAAKKQLTKHLPLRLTFLGLLIGAQGLLGWYMVKSGLEDSLMSTPGAVARVSQYRLASHLGLAFVLYAGMFGTGMAVIKDWKFAHGTPWAGGMLSSLQNPSVKRFKALSWALTGLVFITAMSGAFVAGLDAGLVYNEFPYMGDGLMPPISELFSPAYAKASGAFELFWRNMFENPTTVQFNHRVLAVTTYLSTAALTWHAFRPAMRRVMPRLGLVAIGAAFGVVNVQLLLGISTLIYLVPVPLAAAHQAGSVMLLSAMVHLLVTLRKPGAAARVWRAALQAKKPLPAEKHSLYRG